MCSTEALGYAMQVLDVIVLPMSITGGYTPPSGSTSSIRILRPPGVLPSVDWGRSYSFSLWGNTAAAARTQGYMHICGAPRAAPHGHREQAARGMV